MKKLIAVLISCCTAASLFAQANKTYHCFIINRKAGLTDSSCHEILPPIYQSDVVRDLESNQWVFEDSSHTMVFNPQNGVLHKFELFKSHYWLYNNTLYAKAKDAGKYYMLQENNGNRITLPPGHEGLVNMGPYFLKTMPYTQSHSTVVKPQKPGPVSKKNKPLFTYSIFLKPDDTLPIKQIVAEEYYLLRKEKDYTQLSPEEEGFGLLTTRQPIYLNQKVDYIVFRKAGNLQIYDPAMKLLKTVRSTAGYTFELYQDVSSAIGVTVGELTYHFPPQVTVEMPNQYPMLRSESVDKDKYLLYKMHKPYGEKDPVFFAQGNISFYDGMIILYDGDAKIATGFDMDPVTNKIFLPQRYITALPITWSKEDK